MNFALIMFLLLVATGAIWLLDHFVLKSSREPDQAEPWWIEYPKSFFPVILIVFLLRSFLVEPFKIPSGSMLPTLLVGDFILVNKFTYGIRLPIVNIKLFDMNDPRRGEIMVFRYPENPSVDYIKRVVGLPGDRIAYRNKRLWINGEEVAVAAAGEYNYVEPGSLEFVPTLRFSETLGTHQHAILIKPKMPTVELSGVRPFPSRDNCTYNDSGLTCTVPPGHYFLMGDNRDSSSDSRYWGFVPERNIVGKAFLIWWNFDDFKRIGRSIN
ncbi:MAG: signal peptidase I [Betaproteobacteria bacterium]|nr:signal peptidase I [Betaproteobacteria bacterium]